MLDFVAIAQSSPGPIAVNGAIVIGYKICGFPGILVAVLGAIIPPFVILTVISAFYAAFKTNPYMLRGLMSGITRISKESIFSDLNNLRVITTTSEAYADKFGFTQDEVDDALLQFGIFFQQ